MYENEIFCLLGHNGAGKTTTINLMTGMLAKDSGKIIINTHDIDYELD
jgi:ATP-binding cassette subfamily A (ABC1) protein 3